MGIINDNLQTPNAMRAKPFLKWAGGKSQLLTQFEQLYPRALHNRKITNYVEPFIGGGAVFFDLMQRYDFKKAYISDINVDLILTYQVVQNKVEQLIGSLKEYQNKYNQLNEEKRLELFLNIREQFNQRKVVNKPSVEIATQLIFLNKTCFNGLFRLNSKGGFNVPFGKYTNPAILQEANLRLVSKVLQNVEIKAANYDACFDKVDSNTLVYFDPPYRPLS
jgi:DNA adenine methylase